jgi:hypothetical protein
MQIRTGKRCSAGIGLLVTCLLVIAPADAQPQSGEPTPADEVGTQADDDDAPPWFTGPLLVPGATMLGAGGLLAQGYLYAGEGLGIYNNGLSARRTAVETTINGQLLLGYGFTDRFETQLDVQFIWNTDSGESAGGAGDTQLEFHYLIASDDASGWMPAVRADYIQVFPSGEFEELDAAKNGTDALGSGTWAPTLALNFTKTFHLGGEHFLRPDVSIIYSMPLDRRVHGLNVYGGGQGTDGTLDPGNALTGYLSGEFSFTRNWAVGFDSTYTYVDSTTFTGNPGLNPDGSVAMVGTNSSYQITLSPQLEYNFDSEQGIVLGPWFTLTGRNAEQFFSFVISYAIEFDTPPLF